MASNLSASSFGVIPRFPLPKDYYYYYYYYYYKSFSTGKHTGNRPLGRPRRRWEDNIRMNLEVIGINAGNWVNSAQDRNYWKALVNAALNFQVP